MYIIFAASFVFVVAIWFKPLRTQCFRLRPSASSHLAFAPLSLSGMALSSLVLSVDEAAAGLAALEPGLLFVLDHSGVPAEIQSLLGHLGFKTLALFSRLGASDAEVRQFLTDDLKVDLIGGGARAKLAAAALSVGWDAARRRMEKRLDEEALQRAADGAPRPVSKSSYLDARRAYESFRRTLEPGFILEDKRMPSKAYFELLLERAEDGALRPETLAEVLTAEAETEDPWSVVRAGSDGVMRIQKARTKGTPPVDPESLRVRYRVMAAAWQCVAFRLPNAPFLQGYRESLFMVLLEHLLGDQVYGYTCEAVEGFTHSCSWAQLLAFEYQLRRRAFGAMEERNPFPTAVTIAVQDEPTRRQYFETPMAMSAGAAMASRGRASGSGQQVRTQAGRGKSAGQGAKGKGKGKVKKNDAGTKTNPQDKSELFCYRFQKGKCAIKKLRV